MSKNGRAPESRRGVGVGQQKRRRRIYSNTSALHASYESSNLIISATSRAILTYFFLILG